jgi:hypothetical protein
MQPLLVFEHFHETVLYGNYYRNGSPVEARHTLSIQLASAVPSVNHL